jgi:hypothetical protein
MTYTELNIQQRINAKGNALVCWQEKAKTLFRHRDDQVWNCKMYTPAKLMLESQINNRNYDGPGDNYYQQ